jgi:hypothetical protein
MGRLIVSAQMTMDSVMDQMEGWDLLRLRGAGQLPRAAGFGRRGEVLASSRRLG